MKVKERAYKIQTETWKPKSTENWPCQNILKIGSHNMNVDDFAVDIKKYCKDKKWVFPDSNIHFISDLHADSDALYKSLIGAEIIEKTGVKDSDYTLLEKGKNESIIIGGDCLDKGPSNLRLLDAIKSLKDKGAKVELLAGNHDIRTFVGLALAENRRTVEQHMFVRMGKKTIPLFREIYKKYLHQKIDHSQLLSAEEVEKKLFPSQKWFDTYAAKMEGLIPPKKIEKECDRIREKIEDIRQFLIDYKFSHGLLYATLLKAQALFLDEKGEYAWFFKDMKVAIQEGSFIIVHAGLDDFSTDWIGQLGVQGLNEKFNILMRNDPFELYNGHIGNLFRTKYRDTEFPFSLQSVKKLHRMGINAIIHGHRNTTQGHRVTIKRGMLNFECDTSLDRNTRKAEKLKGYGAAWCTIKPEGEIIAYCTDYPHVKLFSAIKMGGQIVDNLPKKKSKEFVKKKIKDSEINLELTENRSEIKKILLQLADEIDKGEVYIQTDASALLAHLPENNLKLAIKGKSKNKQGNLTIDLKWKT